MSLVRHPPSSLLSLINLYPLIPLLLSSLGACTDLQASKGTEITCVWCRCAWPSAGAGGGKAAGSGGVQYTSTG